MQVRALQLRGALASDAPAIARLYRLLVEDAHIDVRPERLAEIAADARSHLLVAQWDQAVAGTVFLSLCLDPMYGRQPFAVVENLVVDPGWRGRGVGRALLQEVERISRGADCSKIMLHSALARTQAHALFERCGYAGDRKRGFVKYRSRFGAG